MANLWIAPPHNRGHLWHKTSPCLFFSDEHRESALADLAKHILSRQESALNRSVLEQESDFQAKQEHAGRKPLETESSLYPLLRWKKKRHEAFDSCRCIPVHLDSTWRTPEETEAFRNLNFKLKTFN